MISKITATQIKSMEYVLIELIKDGAIDTETKVCDILNYCDSYFAKVKQDYDNAKSIQNYTINYSEDV